jgi:hypothetical protein
MLSDEERPIRSIGIVFKQFQVADGVNLANVITTRACPLDDTA